MRVLITGGTGFIGARLAVMARDAGHEVRLTGLVNTPAEAERKRALEAAGIGVLVRPLKPPVWQGFDAIIHLAAAEHEINVPDGHFGKINRDATRSLFRSGATLRFVQGSTIGVYGTQSGTSTRPRRLPRTTSTAGPSSKPSTGCGSRRAFSTDAARIEQRVVVDRHAGAKTDPERVAERQAPAEDQPGPARPEERRVELPA